MNNNTNRQPVVLSKEQPQPHHDRTPEQEREHRAYLRLCEKFEEYKVKRLQYRTAGTVFVIVSALVYLTLMFSLPHKIFFLILWIITILFCVALMLRADYLYNMYREMLGLPEEEEPDELETTAQPKKPKEPPETEQAKETNAASPANTAPPAPDGEHSGGNG